MNRTRRGKLFHWLIYISFLILVVIIADNAAKVITPYCSTSGLVYDKNLIWKYTPNWCSNSIFYEFVSFNDTNIIWKYVPNRRGGNLSFNSLGFRGREYTLNYDTKITRIAFLGDSYTASLGTVENETFPRILESKLNSNMNDKKIFEVLNFGVSGYATDQEYILLKEIALQFKPSIVVLVIAPNDIRESYMKRLFYLDGAELKIDKDNKAFNLNLKDEILWYLAVHSAIFNELQTFFGLNYGTFDYIFDKVIIGAFFEETHGLNQDQVLFLRNETVEMRHAITLFEALIENINNATIGNGAKLILVNLPIKMQFNDGLKNDSLDTLKIQRIVEKIAGKNNIELLDLYPVFNNTTNPLDYYFAEPRYHLNERGNELVGEALYSFLKSRGYV